MLGRPRRLGFVGIACLALGAGLLAGCADKAGTVEIADIHGTAVDPAEGRVLYVATHHGLFRATNDAEWDAVTKDPFDMMGFTMHPSNSSLMYASGHPRTGGLLGYARSTDAGQTWRVIALQGQVDFHAMTLSLAQPERTWGYFRATVQRSEDGGFQWAPISKGTPPQITGLASSPASPDLLYAAGPGGIHRSRDGGATFEPLHTQGGAATVIGTTKSDPNLLVAYFARGGLQGSTDAGATWSSLNLTFAGDDGAAAVAVDPQDSDTIYVGSYRALIRKTTDGGASWATIR